MSRRYAAHRGHAGRGRRDIAEPLIVMALETCGASVTKLSGADCPDLLIGIQGRTVLLEVKTGKAKLRPGQVKWRSGWRGADVHTVRTVDEALRAIGVRDVASPA